MREQKMLITLSISLIILYGAISKLISSIEILLFDLFVKFDKKTWLNIYNLLPTFASNQLKNKGIWFACFYFY
jgi:hypothetical protein